MKKLKSLALTFTLAAAGVVGLGSAAQAQTIPVNGGITVTQQQQPELVTNNYIDQNVVNAISQLPMNSTYYYNGVDASGRATVGRGFTEASVDQTGERVGVEYALYRDGTRSPIGGYNLDDAYGAQRYQSATLNASQAATAQLRMNTTIITPVYVPPPVYVYRPSIVPLILFGPVFKPWHNNHHYNRYDYHPPRHNTTIIIRGGNDRNDGWRDGRGGRDHRDGRDNRGGRGDRDHRGPGGHRH